jgi:hypothetical protein
MAVTGRQSRISHLGIKAIPDIALLPQIVALRD